MLRPVCERERERVWQCDSIVGYCIGAAHTIGGVEGVRVGGIYGC